MICVENYKKKNWKLMNIICLILDHNSISTFNPDIIPNNPKSVNLRAFRYAFRIYWGDLLFKLHKTCIVGITQELLPVSNMTVTDLIMPMKFVETNFYILSPNTIDAENGSRRNGLIFLRVQKTFKYSTY